MLSCFGCVFLIICFGHAGHCAQKSANLSKNIVNTPARKGGATLVTAYMQPEHSKTLGSFDLRFGLCFFVPFAMSTCWKEIFSTCLSRESILRKSKHGGSWEGHYTPPGLHYGCIMPIPSLQLQKNPVLYREAEGLVTELWSPGLIKEYSDVRCFHVTIAKQWIILEIEHLTTLGWKWGCQLWAAHVFKMWL